MKQTLFIIFALSFFAACSSPSPFEGYKKSGKGFYYQLVTIGETDQEIKTGDYVTADITYATLVDSVFFEGRRKIEIESPAYKGAIEDCIMSLRNNESASFIIESAPFFNQTLETNLPDFLKESVYFKINISIIDVQTEQQYLKEKQAFLHWTEDFGDYEKVLLQQFVAQENFNANPTETGLIYLPLENGDGKNIEIGDTISIHYEGIFLNGKYFDSTKRRKQPFQFVYGTEWQVIEGLEEGLSFMREGDKALFVVPSKLAFGASGSSTGIVPPFTSLIFEVDVLEVKKGVQLQ